MLEDPNIDVETLRSLEKSAVGVIVDKNGEILHQGPMAVRQQYDLYTEEEHDVWKILYTRQRAQLEEIGYPVWLEAGDRIGLSAERIPKFSDLRKEIKQKTGWQPVPVEGFLDAHDYFSYLAKRQFPTVPSIRKREELEFISAPDVFHDAFGHLPMHTHPTFADFLQLFGQTALKSHTEEEMIQMQRLYWFTVEYCIIDYKGELRVCGSGHMSGIKEARYSLTDEVTKKPFNLDDVIHQEFNPHILQPIMFVIDSYDQLYAAMQEMAERMDEKYPGEDEPKEPVHGSIFS